MTEVSIVHAPPRPSPVGEPVWELAELYPRQGAWTVEEYLLLDGNRLVEFEDGSLEFLTMPSVGHQRVLGFLYQLLTAWAIAHRRSGPLLAPLPVMIRPGKFREPDLVLPVETPSGAAQQLGSVAAVFEVVSPDAKSRQRDYVVKRMEYAGAGIPEYWIVDPVDEKVTVLSLLPGAGEYTLHGEFSPGQQATSATLTEFQVDVRACFAAADLS